MSAARPQPQDHLAAVEAEAEAGDQPVTVRLIGRSAPDGVDITVMPFGEWGTVAFKAMKAVELEVWAEESLDEDNLALWQQARPNNNQGLAFIEAWSVASGQSPGESRASRRSSKSTARR